MSGRVATIHHSVPAIGSCASATIALAGPKSREARSCSMTSLRAERRRVNSLQVLHGFPVCLATDVEHHSPCIVIPLRPPKPLISVFAQFFLHRSTDIPIRGPQGRLVL